MLPSTSHAPKTTGGSYILLKFGTGYIGITGVDVEGTLCYPSYVKGLELDPSCKSYQLSAGINVTPLQEMTILHQRDMTDIIRQASPNRTPIKPDQWTSILNAAKYSPNFDLR